MYSAEHNASEPMSDPSHPLSRRIRVYQGIKTVERFFHFSELPSAPLLVDAVYLRGTQFNNIKDDPLNALFPKRSTMPGCGTQGGFRTIGGGQFGKCATLILASSGDSPNWPDRLDAETGMFTYYGDNRTPGFGLRETPRGGNRLLEGIFGASRIIHERPQTPPILVFVKSESARGKGMTFRGLAVPFFGIDEGLVAIWRQTDGRRFQNYRATFAILKCPEVPRNWLNALAKRDHIAASAIAPFAWKNWIATGAIDVLRAPRTIHHRSRAQQLPIASDKIGRGILTTIRGAVARSPHDFEFIAAEIFRMIEPRVFDIEITRKSVDGGRDATGRLRIGGDEGQSDGIFGEFALEAKAYSESNSLGVKETSRLISRLRHRQFGVIVTTSFVGTQAYKELREDKHPVVIIAAIDIARILRGAGLTTANAVQAWIDGILANAEPRLH